MRSALLEVTRDSQDGHQLGADGDAELGLHHVAVQTAADADGVIHVAQALRAEFP